MYKNQKSENNDVPPRCLWPGYLLGGTLLLVGGMKYLFNLDLRLDIVEHNLISNSARNEAGMYILAGSGIGFATHIVEKIIKRKTG